MALRRPSWSRPCLCHLASPLAAARQDPPVRWIRSGGVERRRHFASVSSNRFSSTHEANSPPLPGQPIKDTDLLGNLLSAIRRKDVAAISTSFLAWTEELRDSSLGNGLVMEQFMNLPSPVLSEIIRNMDPINRPELDASHGMNIQQGETRFTDNGKHVDMYGVRVHHRKVLQGMLTIMKAREGHRFALRPADFTVMLRCVGAAVDFRAAPIVFGAMADHGLVTHRTTQTWIEFLKARFLVEPEYYQHDRTRIAVDPRDLVTHHDLVSGNHDMLRRLDRVRLSSNAFLREPWNRRRDQPDEDLRRQLRRRGDATQDFSDYRSFWRHFVRQEVFPDELSEELLCTSMMGFARSSDRHAVLNVILKNYYDIEVDEENHTVTGGRDFPLDSPLYPTSRLLFTMVETFGAMSEISLAMQLVDFVSQRYDVEITPKIWSNLLSWSYLSASKKYQHLRKILQDGENTRMDAHDVIHVWKIMTSEPYNIKPSFQDLDIHIRTRIIVGHMSEAIDLIENTAMPYYDTIADEFYDAFMDESLLKDAIVDPAQAGSTTLSRARHRRREAETLRDHVFNRIATWFDDILRITGKQRMLRTGPFTTTTIPDLIQRYPHFFQTGVRYRTANGEVTIRHWDDSRHIRFTSEKPESRNVLPAKYGAVAVPAGSVDAAGERRMLFDPDTGDRFENPDFAWPRTDPMRIVEMKLEPRRRLDELPAVPRKGCSEEEKRRWRGTVAAQMMI